MLARNIRNQFDQSATYVARRPLTLDGRDYQPGEPIAAEINLRRAMQLFRGRFIMPQQAATAAAEAGGASPLPNPTANKGGKARGK